MKKNPRKTEFVLTLLSGIFGILSSVLVFLGAGLLSIVSSNPEIMAEAELPEGMTFEEVSASLDVLGSGVQVVAGVALVMSIVLIVLSFFLKKNQKNVLFGIIILILSIVPFFLLTFLWIIPGILGIIAGAMLLLRKIPNATEAVVTNFEEDEFTDF
ncbi:hypothetical protein CBF34_00670 [Vagococcus penaei]|uniref:Uncharacterized protein n=1 Tax=Vagococcus penaei TaxID=633807 RepID=A0A1Q2D5G5_9ENTE|nr:DUF4064 domain-containing protein [Vagococcus penaei]AQP53609.1 hypothetical protein BW732_04750 [Vagococcus penaei]RSU07553.1 hypothetical protein CBF34_00670 [Vagococcus penaei]